MSLSDNRQPERARIAKKRVRRSKLFLRPNYGRNFSPRSLGSVQSAGRLYPGSIGHLTGGSGPLGFTLPGLQKARCQGPLLGKVYPLGQSRVIQPDPHTNQHIGPLALGDHDFPLQRKAMAVLLQGMGIPAKHLPIRIMAVPAALRAIWNHGPQQGMRIPARRICLNQPAHPLALLE